MAPPMRFHLMPAFLIRFIPLVVAGVALWLLVRALSREIGGGARQRNGHTTFKPRWRAKSTTGTAQGTPGQAHIMSREQLVGLRDALTSAPIDPNQSLVCCGQCRSVYHQESADALANEHGGACVNCGGHDLGPVHLNN
jgi:hypothetical protein